MYREVKFPLVRDGTKIVYPDDRNYFKDCTVENGFVVGKYNGVKSNEEIPDRFQSVSIDIWDISGALGVNEEKTFAESKMGDILNISVNVDLSEGDTLRIPIRRVDDGRTVYVFSTVSNGEAVFSLSLPTSGKWYCDESLLNQEGRLDTIYSFKGLTVLQGL